MKLKILTIFLLIISMTACFNEETRYVAYLEKDGTVTFHAYVVNVYSTEIDEKKRKIAEKKLLENLMEETNIPLIKILEEKGGNNIKVVILHNTLPFSYVVKADFDSFEDFLDIFTNEENNLSFDVDVKIGKKKGYIKIKNSEFNTTTKTSINKENKEEEEIRFFISGGYNIKSDKLSTSGENSFTLNSSIFENCEITWDYFKNKKKNSKQNSNK